MLPAGARSGVDSLRIGPADLDEGRVTDMSIRLGVARPSWICLLPVRSFRSRVPALLATRSPVCDGRTPVLSVVLSCS